MNRRFRLNRSTDIQRVRQDGKAVRHPLLVMIVGKSAEPVSRIGVISGRGVGNAVRRNRAKRLIRHAVQSYIANIQPGWDILLIARVPIAGSTYLQVSEALGSLFERSGILCDLEICCS